MRENDRVIAGKGEGNFWKSIPSPFPGPHPPSFKTFYLLNGRRILGHDVLKEISPEIASCGKLRRRVIRGYSF
jgi:hypothetical protein